MNPKIWLHIHRYDIQVNLILHSSNSHSWSHIHQLNIHRIEHPFNQVVKTTYCEFWLLVKTKLDNCHTHTHTHIQSVTASKFDIEFFFISTISNQIIEIWRTRSDAIFTNHKNANTKRIIYPTDIRNKGAEAAQEDTPKDKIIC